MELLHAMDPYQLLAFELAAFLKAAYPDIQIRAEVWADDPSRIAIYFIEAKFKVLYPWQRYHYLRHNIPQDYSTSKLANTVWFELAPGESPSDLAYPGDGEIEEITPHVMQCVEASGFLALLDNALCPESALVTPARCHGDFRLSKELLSTLRFDPGEVWDVLHVLMSKGSYCDCEVLYNIAHSSRMRERYWRERAANSCHGNASGVEA